MMQDRPWFASYPDGMPHEIDVEQYRSIVSALESTIDKYRDRPAYLNFGKILTYADLDRLSGQMASYLLHELKLKRGARVAVMMPNCLQFPISIFGILRAGLTVVNVNPLYTSRELHHQLQDSGAAALIVIDNFGDTAAQALPGTQVKHVVSTALGDMLGLPKGPLVNFVLRYLKKMVPDYEIDGAVRFRDALALGKGKSLPKLDIQPDDIAFLQYTGGTTGVAKGAMLTHRNLVANMQQASIWVGSKAGRARNTSSPRCRSTISSP